MDLIKIKKEKIFIEMSKKELELLFNALNEVCNVIEEWEFDTRLGIKLENAKNILYSLSSILKHLNQKTLNN